MSPTKRSAPLTGNDLSVLDADILLYVEEEKSNARESIWLASPRSPLRLLTSYSLSSRIHELRNVITLGISDDQEAINTFQEKLGEHETKIGVVERRGRKSSAVLNLRTKYEIESTRSGDCVTKYGTGHNQKSTDRFPMRCAHTKCMEAKE